MKKTVVCLLVLMAFVAFPLTGEDNREKQQVAILELEQGEGISIHDNLVVRQLMKDYLEKHNYGTVDSGEIASTQKELGIHSISNYKQALAIGEACEADLVIFGAMKKTTGIMSVTVALIDMQKRVVKNIVDYTYSDVNNYENFITIVTAKLMGNLKNVFPVTVKQRTDNTDDYVKKNGNFYGDEYYKNTILAFFKENLDTSKYEIMVANYYLYDQLDLHGAACINCLTLLITSIILPHWKHNLSMAMEIVYTKTDSSGEKKILRVREVEKKSTSLGLMSTNRRYHSRAIDETLESLMKKVLLKIESNQENPDIL